MPDQPQSTTAEALDSWALVELFGRTRIVGRVTEATVAGSNFLRIDVPEFEGNPKFTRFYGPSSVYCISPISKEIADELMKTCRNEPVARYDIRQLAEKYSRPESPYGEVEEP